MKKLLVCLILCIMVSVVAVKIEGIPVPETYNITHPEYEGSDIFVVTFGEETESAYIIMKDGKVLKIETLSDEWIDEFIEKQKQKQSL